MNFGLFSFLKSAGKKLPSQTDVPAAADVKKELDSLTLGTENVEVSIAGDTVILKGTVKDQATFEKSLLAVGNTHGIAHVNTAGLTVANAAAGMPVLHTVKPGDTLWKIAEAQYGKGQGDKSSFIFEANWPMLASPETIYPGQVLRIPPGKLDAPRPLPQFLPRTVSSGIHKSERRPPH